VPASLPEHLRIADLGGRRVALWGWGHEGHAAYRALRTRLPQQALTLFCSEAEAIEAAALGDALLRIEHAPTGARLAAFDVVVKSPGISPNKPEAVFAAQQGTRFLGGTALWFAERAGDGSMARTCCVTGTKGKSTTSSLLAHLLRAAQRTAAPRFPSPLVGEGAPQGRESGVALAGNIGVPLLELLDANPATWVIELSSYQTRDVAAAGAHPHIAIVTNLHPEHLDWHGSETRYLEDKLALVTAAKPQIAVLNAADPLLAQLQLPDSDIHWYGDARGWHLREDALYRGDTLVMDTAALPLPGRHNRSNLCAVLTALEAFGLDAAALAPHAASFQPLPNRLQALGEKSGILYVNDSISTTPMATQAALDLYAGRDVAVLIGGHDRGLPWEEFAEAMRLRAPTAIITLGHGLAAQNGPRIHALLAPIAAQAGFTLEAAQDLEEALRKARAALPHGGVILLSPGAPSFGAYKNYVERGRHFAALAGFNPDVIAGIAGMGIA
jgi:UDP-N-acetylmuramoylalanine--D-glutamate ligase